MPTDLKVRLIADAGGFRGVVDGASRDLGRLGDAGTRAGQKIRTGLDDASVGVGRYLASLASVAAVSAGIRASISAAVEAEQTQTKLAAVLRATGYSAGITAAQINNLADQLSNTTLFDDEQIRNASAVMLTFRNISGDTFQQAIGLSADLSAVLGTDLQSSIIQVGKALNDPATGVSALGRAGITFSTVQKDMINGFLKTNDLAAAQAIVLKELEKQFGGTAEKMNSGLSKSTRDLKKSWDEMLESIGNSLPAQSAIGWIKEMADSIKAFSNDPSLRNLGAAFNPFVPVVDRSGSSRAPAGSGLIDRGNLPPGAAALGREDALAALGRRNQEQSQIDEANQQRRAAADEARKKQAAKDLESSSRIFAATRTPQEQFIARMTDLNRLHKAGAVDVGLYNRAALDYVDTLVKQDGVTKNLALSAEEFGQGQADNLKRLQSLLDDLNPNESAARKYLEDYKLLAQYLEGPELEGAIDSLGKRFADESQRRVEVSKTFAQEFVDIWGNAAVGFNISLGQSVADAILEQKKFSDFLRVSVKSMAREVIAALISIGVRRAIDFAFGESAKAASTATSIAAAAATAIAWAPAAAAVSLATAGANSVPAGTGISSVYALSSGLSLAGVAHDGFASAPRTGPYLIQEGERVVKKDDNKRLTKFLEGQASGRVEINFTVTGQDAPRAVDIVKAQRNQIIALIQSAYDERGRRGGPVS